MKTRFLRLSAILLTITPMIASAQNNVKSAFDDIINCKDAKITSTHELEKDPDTMRKSGQCDIYYFTIPAKNSNLVKNALSAFDKDADLSYAMKNGQFMKGQKDVLIAIGTDANQTVSLARDGFNYIYSLFPASLTEDPEEKFRYAYGMNYKTAEDGTIEGKLVVTYATNLKHRMKESEKKRLELLNGLDINKRISSTVDSTQKSWFETVMTYLQGMVSSHQTTKISLATKAYSTIKDIPQYPEVTPADKNAVREILKTMIADKKYSEPILNKLLNQCLTNLESQISTK